MIAEFIGCAGAGKTTFARMICERGIPEGRVVMMSDLLLDRPLLRWVRHPTAANIVQEIGSFPFFVGGWRGEHEFVEFSGRMLVRSCGTFDTLNGMRGIVRKLGMYRLARSRGRDMTVLSDEGTLLSAYNLFVMTSVGFDRSKVDTFLRLVPLPDRVVYVRAPMAALVERAHSRETPRRQHRGRSADQVEVDVRRTIELFELVAASPLVADRLQIVENDDEGEAAMRRRAQDIASWLQAPASTRRPVETVVGSLGLGSKA